MVNVEVTYNPYTVRTEIAIDGKPVDKKVSLLAYTDNKRLQEWIEPRGSWKGFFAVLRNSAGDARVTIEFTGTSGDYKDLEYAKNRYGGSFEQIDLIHKNRDSAGQADPFQKMRSLEKLYGELQNGPAEEFKTEDIRKNFEAAINSDFRIVVVAPMSSGKSTLINAIIGRDMLPAVNQAATSVITEIKADDSRESFLLSAVDKYGRETVKNEKATKERIKELNYAKDPQDPKKEAALYRRIRLEGRIPNLPSEPLNTVFVDTPGGTYALNAEHEAVMDEAINDENKSLILYVFNGTQLGTNDSNIILRKIANAMQNSANGKQSRDRFLFVANRMDDFDLEKEHYEDAIDQTIHKMLEYNGITEPNLFLASAQTARLIRMNANGEKLTEDEEAMLEFLVKRFNNSKRMLSSYASLNADKKEALNKFAEQYMEEGKKTSNEKQAEENRFRAAEINSGIPAIEAAIREYLEKYAIAIKIKTVHDVFMKKVRERDMIHNCEAEWARTQEAFETVKKEIRCKREQCNHSRRQQAFRDKVDAMQLDTTPIDEKRAEVNGRIFHLAELAKDKIEIEEAENYLMQFRKDLNGIAEEAQEMLERALDNGVRNTCQNILEEYDAYIKELDAEDAFNIGGYDIKLTEAFDAYKIDKVEDMLYDGAYISEDQVLAGKERVKKKGFLAAVQRLFRSEKGYTQEDKYRTQQFFKLKQFIMAQVNPYQKSFEDEVTKMIEDTEKKVAALKQSTREKLEGIDQLIARQLDEIDKMLGSQEKLQQKVKADEAKTKWIKDFVNKVEDLLTV